MMFSSEAVEQEEELIRQAANQLSDDERRIYFGIVKTRIKDPDTYAVLNWFFIAGLHHFYLKRWIRGCVDLAIFLVGIVFIPAGFAYESRLIGWLGVLMIVGISIVELNALFRSQTIVQDYNNQVMQKTLIEIRNKQTR